RGAGDGRRLEVREHDRLLGTDAAACGAAFLAAVLIFDQNPLLAVNAVDAEEAEVETFQAVGAAAVIDDGIPAAAGRCHQLVRREARRSVGFWRRSARQAEGNDSGAITSQFCLFHLLPLLALRCNATNLIDKNFVFARVA